MAYFIGLGSQIDGVHVWVITFLYRDPRIQKSMRILITGAILAALLNISLHKSYARAGCAAGKYSSSGSGCVNCGIGKYSSFGTSCLECSPGSECPV